jgi:hypothetical protein
MLAEEIAVTTEQRADSPTHWHKTDMPLLQADVDDALALERGALSASRYVQLDVQVCITTFEGLGGRSHDDLTRLYVITTTASD